MACDAQTIHFLYTKRSALGGGLPASYATEESFVTTSLGKQLSPLLRKLVKQCLKQSTLLLVLNNSGSKAIFEGSTQ